MEKIWLDKWEAEHHTDKKQQMFNIVNSHLTQPPKRILDIGCGLAVESELFQKEYGCELYLLDGDFESTVDRNRTVNYGNADSMAFYSRVADLKESWDTRNLKYTFLDANNLVLDESVKFDLVYSFESCGFHYPVETYKSFLQKHTTSNSILIFDVRKKTLTEQRQTFSTVNELYDSKKYKTLSINV